VMGDLPPPPQVSLYTTESNFLTRQT
jgi:hypothetical protein